MTLDSLLIRNGLRQIQGTLVADGFRDFFVKLHYIADSHLSHHLSLYIRRRVGDVGVYCFFSVHFLPPDL